MDERIEDLLAVYALGGLSEQEIEEVEAFLAEHPEADSELAEMMQVVDALAFAPEPLQLSPTMENELMARVIADSTPAQLEAVPQNSVPVQQAPHQTSIWDVLKQLFAQPAFGMSAAALALFLFAFLFVLQGRNQALLEEQQNLSGQVAELKDSISTLASENDQLTGNVEQLNTDIDTLTDANVTLASENALLIEQIATLSTDNEELLINNSDLAQAQIDLASEIANLMMQNDQLVNDVESIQTETQLAQNVLGILQSPEVEAITVPGFPDTQPDATGQIVLDNESNTAVLIVTGLEPLPQGSVYQVLLIQGAEHETAETFLVDTQGESVLIVSSNSNLGAFDAVGVSIEPEGGSEQRTGDIVLLGSLVSDLNDS